MLSHERLGVSRLVSGKAVVKDKNLRQEKGIKTGNCYYLQEIFLLWYRRKVSIVPYNYRDSAVPEEVSLQKQFKGNAPP